MCTHHSYTTDPPTRPEGRVKWSDGYGYVSYCGGTDGDEPVDCIVRAGRDEAGWWWVADGDDAETTTSGPFSSRAAAEEAAEEIAYAADEEADQ